MALVRQLLTIDEHSMDARVLQDAIRSDMQRDVDDARALLEESGRREDGQKYRKAAEIILLKTLYVDPAHVEAKALLAKVKGGTEPVQQPEPVNKQEVYKQEPVYTEMPRRKADDDLAFTAQPEPVEQTFESEGRRKIPIILVGPALVLVLAGVFYFRSPDAADSEEPAQNPSVAASAAAPTSPPVAAPSAPPLSPVNTAQPPATTEAVAASAALQPAMPVEPPAPVTGSLEVNSPVPADIYMGKKHLGTTPTTLQFSPGRYILEYRYRDLRTVMTHEIKSKKTVTVTVPFETNVQINARPWAQVFLEGTSRQALGQTPLSSVRVPIGSVLTFEHPNFTPKSHRVTETDSSIQMAFP
jgi:hypothetical protein